MSSDVPILAAGGGKQTTGACLCLWCCHPVRQETEGEFKLLGRVFAYGAVIQSDRKLKVSSGSWLYQADYANSVTLDILIMLHLIMLHLI